MCHGSKPTALGWTSSGQTCRTGKLRGEQISVFSAWRGPREAMEGQGGPRGPQTLDWQGLLLGGSSRGSSEPSGSWKSISGPAQPSWIGICCLFRPHMVVYVALT